MKKSDLIWAICEIDEDLLRVTEEEPDMKKRTTRPLRMLLVAAIVGALLVGSALAVRYWDELFVKSFGMTDSDKELMDSAFQDVYASATQDGVTCTVTQILGMEHCMMVGLEIKLPDDMEPGSASAEELKAYIGYEPDMPDAPYLDGIILYPVHMEKEELMSEYDDLYERIRLAGDDVSRIGSHLLRNVLSDKLSETSGKGYGSSGSGTINSSYDPETRTLTTLHYVYFSGSMQGKPYTLVVDSLYAPIATEDNASGSKIENLLSSPIVIHFNSEYQSQLRMYDVIREDGTTVGALELSQLSAYLNIPQEQDDPDTPYSSLEEAAQAGEKRLDYVDGVTRIYVQMTDGSEQELKIRSGDSNGAAFYITDEIIDLSQVKGVRLGDYTLTPRSGG